MLDELKSNYLEVAKVPTREGGYVRVVVSVNAAWYRKFCADYASYNRRRRLRNETIIKRAHTIRALKEIISGFADSVYAKRLLPVVIGIRMQEHPQARRRA